jgi:multidrug transporter EmrE-like cation transporter
MNTPWAALMVFCFMVAQAGSAICFKYASAATGPAAWWWFIAGNAVGFNCTWSLTLALGGQQPNLIFAFCYGGGFLLLQGWSWWLFRAPMAPGQWAGVALIGAGIFLLQIKPS